MILSLTRKLNYRRVHILLLSRFSYKFMTKLHESEVSVRRRILSKIIRMTSIINRHHDDDEILQHCGDEIEVNG